MTRSGNLAAGTLIACAIALLPVRTAANTQHEKGQKKAAAHDLTGCLEKDTEPNTYKLTNVEGKGPKAAEIIPASGVDLAAHVGHKVTITGEAMKAKEATKAEGETTTGTKGTLNKTREGREHHMRADAVKMISTSCR